MKISISYSIEAFTYSLMHFIFTCDIVCKRPSQHGEIIYVLLLLREA